MTVDSCAKKTRIHSWLGCFFLAFFSFSASAEELARALTEAQALLTAQPAEPTEALQKLQALEEDFAGNQQFDYWLGISAVRAQQPGVALMALNRVLIQQPLHAGARLERVQVYLQLGRDQEAQRDLDYLEELSPPEQAQNAIERYRAVLAERERRKTAPSHLVMLTSEAGYDTNVSRTPDGYELCIRELQGFACPEYTEESSAYGTVRGVYRYRQPLDEQNQVDATLVGQYRGYQQDDVEEYNLAALQGRVNWQHRPNLDETYNLEANINRVWIDQPLDGYLWQTGLRASWDRPFWEETRHRISGHWRWNRYDELDQNNFHLWGLDNQLRHPLTDRLQLQSNLLLEHERAHTNRNGGDLHRLQLGLGAHYQINSRHSVRSQLSFARLLYQQEGFQVFNESLFEATSRRDSRWELSANYDWVLSRQWLLNLQAQHRRQESNIDFYENNQSLIQAGITYIWQGSGQR